MRNVVIVLCIWQNFGFSGDDLCTLKALVKFPPKVLNTHKKKVSKHRIQNDNAGVFYAKLQW